MISWSTQYLWKIKIPIEYCCEGELPFLKHNSNSIGLWVINIFLLLFCFILVLFCFCYVSWGCGPYGFTCDDGQCIWIGLRCDRIVQCRDASDEAYCGEYKILWKYNICAINIYQQKASGFTLTFIETWTRTLEAMFISVQGQKAIYPSMLTWVFLIKSYIMTTFSSLESIVWLISKWKH